MLFNILIYVAIVGIVIVVTALIVRVYDVSTTLRQDLIHKSNVNQVDHKQINVRLSDNYKQDENTKKQIEETISSVNMRVKDTEQKLSTLDGKVKSSVDNLMLNMTGLKTDVANMNTQLTSKIIAVDQELSDDIVLMKDTLAKRIDFVVSEEIDALDDKWAKDYANIEKAHMTFSEQLGATDARILNLTSQYNSTYTTLNQTANDLMTLSQTVAILDNRVAQE
jgi:peptidoglycan hydrolase CwlO-like protein